MPGAGAKAAAVDIHCHVSTPEAAALVKDVFDSAREAMLTFSNEATRAFNRKREETIRGQLTSVEVISPAPQYYCWADPELGRETARLVNNRIAEIAGAHPDRFSASARCRCRRRTLPSPNSSGW